MKQTKILLMILLLNNVCFSQKSFLKGRICDSITKEPIEYTNIGVQNKNLGTLSNSNGEFSLKTNNLLKNDTILFSHLGYKTLKITLEKLKTKKNDSLFLIQNSIILDEVKIESYNFIKGMTFGYDYKHPRVSYEFIDFKSGSEIGRYFENENTLILDKLIFQVNKNELKNLKLRINLFDVKNGKPNNKLNNEEIFIETKHHEGRLKFNLKKYNIILDTDFFLSLEAVDVIGNGIFLFVGEWYGGKTFYKKNSHDKWKISEPHSIAFRLKTKINKN